LSANGLELVTGDRGELTLNSSSNGSNGHHQNGNGTVSTSPEILAGTIQNEELIEKSRHEWKITRKLRVTSQGTYTSTYYINDSPCTLGDLHQQLSRLRIYPEGYNVVLQGDVTSIISMNSRDRREIIDELAGVGEFDRKINQAKDKLNEVKAQEDRFRIVEQELIASQEKLKGDRAKAEKYQALRIDLEKLQSSEAVLHQRHLQYQQAIRKTEMANNASKDRDLKENLRELGEEIELTTVQLNELNDRVHTLGEEEYLAVSTENAAKRAELRAAERKRQDLTESYESNQETIAQLQTEINEYLGQLEQNETQREAHQQEITSLEQSREQQAAIVSQCRRELQAIAASADDWLSNQGQLRQIVDELQANLSPQRQEQARLKESIRQWTLQLTALEAEQSTLTESEGRSSEDELALYQAEVSGAQSLMQNVGLALSQAQVELQTCNETIDRLTQEQRLKNRQLDRLEAQTSAMQEAQGTKASQVIIEADLSGVCGLVAQLGMVESRYQTALEIAAAARLGYLVVENDEVAAEAINLLKRERAGRATFLPLNKMRSARPLREEDAHSIGGIDFAINLIDCEKRYDDVFAYVFGNTIVFEHLEQARLHVGKYRMVTLDGELLETSGAITGGSVRKNIGLHFGTGSPQESVEAAHLRERLMEIDRMLGRLHQKSRSLQTSIEKYEEQMHNARNAFREAQMQCDRLIEHSIRYERDIKRIQEQIQQNSEAIELSNKQLTNLEIDIAEAETRLQATRLQLAEIEKSSTHSQWQKVQADLQTQEQKLNGEELHLATARQKLTDKENQISLLREKISQRQQRLQEIRSQQTELLNASTQVQTQCRQLSTRIEQLQDRLDSLEEVVGAAKQERDACERNLQALSDRRRELEWQVQKNAERQEVLSKELAKIEYDLEILELPEPLPEVPETMTLEQCQLEQRRLQKRLQALEPVNMMAIAEYESVTERLTDLSDRLETLNQERTELLLRIENFTTLRQRAFMQAFNAVNENFKTIFAELSDGDGHLQLENSADPLSGGLHLVAHPKGKQVQHLASMSGGEKSLTALSFIFALQRYRPSPFYAFDEVDMFLDGANVERLSKMVRKQAGLAQFIVVSLRRPMIEASERTIGVTQARGAHTQVLGLELRSG
jgi:chromosome segregation protein